MKQQMQEQKSNAISRSNTVNGDVSAAAATGAPRTHQKLVHGGQGDAVDRSVKSPFRDQLVEPPSPEQAAEGKRTVINAKMKPYQASVQLPNQQQQNLNSQQQKGGTGQMSHFQVARENFRAANKNMGSSYQVNQTNVTGQHHKQSSIPYLVGDAKNEQQRQSYNSMRMRSNQPTAHSMNAQASLIQSGNTNYQQQSNSQQRDVPPKAGNAPGKFVAHGYSLSQNMPQKASGQNITSNPHLQQSPQPTSGQQRHGNLNTLMSAGMGQQQDNFPMIRKSQQASDKQTQRSRHNNFVSSMMGQQANNNAAPQTIQHVTDGSQMTANQQSSIIQGFKPNNLKSRTNRRGAAHPAMHEQQFHNLTANLNNPAASSTFAANNQFHKSYGNATDLAHQARVLSGNQMNQQNNSAANSAAAGAKKTGRIRSVNNQVAGNIIAGVNQNYDKAKDLGLVGNSDYVQAQTLQSQGGAGQLPPDPTITPGASSQNQKYIQQYAQGGSANAKYGVQNSLSNQNRLDLSLAATKTQRETKSGGGTIGSVNYTMSPGQPVSGGDFGQLMATTKGEHQRNQTQTQKLVKGKVDGELDLQRGIMGNQRSMAQASATSKLPKAMGAKLGQMNATGAMQPSGVANPARQSGTRTRNGQMGSSTYNAQYASNRSFRSTRSNRSGKARPDSSSLSQKNMKDGKDHGRLSSNSHMKKKLSENPTAGMPQLTSMQMQKTVQQHGRKVRDSGRRLSSPRQSKQMQQQQAINAATYFSERQQHRPPSTGRPIDSASNPGNMPSLQSQMLNGASGVNRRNQRNAGPVLHQVAGLGKIEHRTGSLVQPSNLNTTGQLGGAAFGKDFYKSGSIQHKQQLLKQQSQQQSLPTAGQNLNASQDVRSLANKTKSRSGAPSGTLPNAASGGESSIMADKDGSNQGKNAQQLMILNKYLQQTTTNGQNRLAGGLSGDRKVLSPYHQQHMQTSPSPMKDPRDKSALAAQQQTTKSLPRESSDSHGASISGNMGLAGRRRNISGAPAPQGTVSTDKSQTDGDGQKMLTKKKLSNQLGSYMLAASSSPQRDSESKNSNNAQLRQQAAQANTMNARLNQIKKPNWSGAGKQPEYAHVTGGTNQGMIQQSAQQDPQQKKKKSRNNEVLQNNNTNDHMLFNSNKDPKGSKPSNYLDQPAPSQADAVTQGSTDSERKTNKSPARLEESGPGGTGETTTDMNNNDAARKKGATTQKTSQQVEQSQLSPLQRRSLPDKYGEYSEIILEQERELIYQKYINYNAALNPIQNIIEAQLRGLIEGGAFLGGMGSGGDNMGVKVAGEMSASQMLNFNPLKDFEEAKFASKSHGLITSYSANTHQGIQRNYNEDRVSIILNMTKPEGKDPATWPKCSFFAIYDGHGGSSCADYLKDHLHTLIINRPCFPADPRKALIEGCREAEMRFLNMTEKASYMDGDGNYVVDKAGSCAIIVLTVETECYVANVGDSRAVLSSENGLRCYDLSQDHRPNEEAEFYRIRDNGGHVYQTQTCQTFPIVDKDGRITGQQKQILTGPYRVSPGRLSVSRTFGDIEAKYSKYGGKAGVISAEPEISQFSIKENQYDFIILGCDGIFEKLSSINVIDCAWAAVSQVLKTYHKSRERNGSRKTRIETIHQVTGKMTDAILRSSALERSVDNLTIVIVAFKSVDNFYEKAKQPQNGNAKMMVIEDKEEE